jgi:hypothetical protein
MRLFRTIRRKLVASGKFQTYLLYALGEILLITIGISIAWKINNMSDINKNKIVEAKIYNSLYDELRTNLGVLDSAIVRYNNSELTLQTTLHYVGLKPDDFTQEVKDLIIQTKHKNTNLRNDALNSINNTNKFEFLENESLKTSIAEYPNEINIYQNQEKKIRAIVENRLQPVIEKHISLIDMLPKDKLFYRIREKGQQSNYSELLHSLGYQNSVIDRLLQTKILLNNAKSLRAKTEKLAIKLKKELRVI